MEHMYTDINNYRPISVLPIVSKLLEKAVHDELYQYLQENVLLSKLQLGFRPGHSTQSALTYLNESILNNVDSGMLTGIVFLDLKKAFDTVDHSLLLTKLKSYGITEVELGWFGNYLTDRKQTTEIDCTKSEYMAITCGVPQGSILGPLLFSIFINDLPSVVKQSQVILYADDTALIYSGKTNTEISKVLNSELTAIKQWLDNSKLTLNIKKSKSMLIGSARKLKTTSELNILLNNQNIIQVDHYKYLGIWLDTKYTFGIHIDKIKQKIAYKIISLMRIKNYLTVKHRQLVFNAIILPHFDYASNIWSSTTASTLKPLVRLYNKSAKIILGVSNRSNTNTALEVIKWPTLDKRWKAHRCVLTYKILNKILPNYLDKIFKHVKDIQTKTRSSTSNLLLPTKFKTNYGKRQLSYIGALDYNKLPPDIRNEPLINSFKFKCKTWV